MKDVMTQEEFSKADSASSRSAEEIEMQEKWHTIGEHLAPSIEKSLICVEAITKQLKKCEVWMLERDMLPFFVANQFKKILSCESRLLPASSSVLGKGVRSALDSAVSFFAQGWSDEQSFATSIQEQLDFLIIDPDINMNLAAFIRSIYSNLGITESFTDTEIFAQLQGKLPAPTLRRKISNIVMFDTMSIGTYIEISAAILNRLFPQITCRGILFKSRNPRMLQLALGKVQERNPVDYIENIPKPYELVVPTDGTIRRKIRESKIGEYWAEFCWGLKNGLQNDTHSVQEPIIVDLDHVEPDLWSDTVNQSSNKPSDSAFQSWEILSDLGTPQALF